MSPAGMRSSTRLGLTLVGLALALGVLGDQLLRAVPWGLNVTLCAVALVLEIGRAHV